MLRKVLIAAVMSGIALSASACNTVRGVGQDIESVANSVDRAT